LTGIKPKLKMLHKSAPVCLAIKFVAAFFLLLAGWHSVFAQTGRVVTELKSGWLFINKDVPDGAKIGLNEKDWQKVTVPHDWAISGPFREENDLQKVQVMEDGEQKAQVRSGRTGGLPYAGVGWYRLHVQFRKQDQGKNYYLEFDGAMSHAKVYVNNRFAGEWPYGYSSFHLTITPLIEFGKDNVIAVRLENFPESSRWYPGAGLYREVRLVQTNSLRIAPWGTFITTPQISTDQALINIQTTLEIGNTPVDNIRLVTAIYNQQHQKIGEVSSSPKTGINTQEINIKEPDLWSADHPVLYYAVSSIKRGNKMIDEYKTQFGIRSITFSPQKGMQVNGNTVKLKGVCLHDDLGPLGMAINKSVLRYRLQLLKEMGCNAIRGSHNPHAPEMLELCDELGFYFIDEAFDEWKSAKVKNGYHLLFDQWAEKDLAAMIKRDRNHPAVVMYSIGNEVREQNEKDGALVARFLTDICHTYDTTRPVTAGFNNMNAAIKNGLADAVDIPGWNYKPGFYATLHQQHPGWVILGTETASTVSSRGVYKLPPAIGVMKTWPDNQSSSYDLEYCSWSQLPDTEWKNQDNDFVAGEFVWTGFDYLGEPTPYNNNWPSRSSYFGIVDLCGIPKDRYYLYQSHWSAQKVLHVLPHWNWKGREGENVPVYVYTNYPSAEVFINGKSFGKKTFNHSNLLDSYRLRWENTIYEPGELKVVGYDAEGNLAEEKIIKTAGQPAQILLKADKTNLTANGEDIALITVTIADKDGNTCPLSDDLIQFHVAGAGKLRAVGNGDPTSLASFEVPERKAFYGKCMVYVQSGQSAGTILVKATGKNLKPCSIELKTVKEHHD
jgi:beta-galactosidase